MFQMTTTRCLLAASAGALMLAPAAYAIDLDTFLDNPSQIVAHETPGAPPSSSSIGTPHAIGNNREMIASGGTGDFGTLGIVGGGTLQFGNTPASAGTLDVNCLPGFIDLTADGSTGFLLTVEFADALVDLTIEVVSPGMNSSTVTTTLPTGISGGGDEQIVYIPYASLTGLADLTDAGQLNLTFAPTNGKKGADLTISNFKTGVPEPSSLALIALGGLAMMRRRRS